MNQPNPFFQPGKTPFDTFPFDHLCIGHYKEAFEQGMAEENAEIARIAEQSDPPTFENTIRALEACGSTLDRVSTVFFNLLEADSHADMEKLAQEISPRIAEHNSEIMLNEKLFRRVQQIWQHADGITGEDFQLLKKTYENFKRNGAELCESDKEEYKQIVSQLSGLTIDFSQNLLADTNAFVLHISNEADLAGLPQSQIHQAAECARSKKLDGWAFTLKAPSYVPFMTYAQNRSLREKMYKAYAFRCCPQSDHSNLDVILRITDLRRRLANLLGYKNYADYVLTRRMAANTTRVEQLFNDLIEAYIDRARNEVLQVQQLAQAEEGPEFTLQAWDFSYYANKLRQQRFDFDDECLRPYFELNAVIQGMFGLAHKLYGIKFKESSEIPVYHSDVRCFEVYDADNTFLAILYMDLFPRDGKQGGAWMTNFSDQYIDLNGIDHRPHVAITTNFTRPTQDIPSLLTFSELETLLHEFGHALHGIFARTRYKSLSGTHVLWDFVELPSQFMENYATEKEFLTTFARHYQTGESIPEELILKVTESRNFNVAYACIKQVSYGLIDMAYYTATAPIDNPMELEERATRRVQLLPRTEGSCMGWQFSHIMSGGYAAGYYSYKWAEVLDADAFECFKKEGIFNQATARRFREELLSKGGTADPMSLYVAFKKREPNIQALLKRNGISHE